MSFAQSIGMVETFTPLPILGIRLVIAAVLGGVIGIEREMHADGAGLRTHVLIATAAALYTLLAFEIFHMSDVAGSGSGGLADPIRTVEAVTAGIAFLGAGAIFQRRNSIQGLTTGAGMWLAGAIGVTAALGYYILATAVALFAVIVLAALRAFAHHLSRPRPQSRS
jgi:putative Mg2+ transporter-C (MgtC) family protein